MREAEKITGELKNYGRGFSPRVPTLHLFYAYEQLQNYRTSNTKFFYHFKTLIINLKWLFFDKLK